MAKWKELGEVPDSDDESTWDSQESLPNRADAANDAALPDIEPDGASQAIWDIPLSSQISIQETHVQPSPNPQKPKSQSSELSNKDAERESSPLSSPFEQADSTEEVAIPAFFDQQQARSEEPRSSPPSLGQFAREEFEPRDIPGIQEIETTDNGPSRLGRSLRPRKPIQEHPYLLESAQYSKQWKSHGLRPVRVSVEEEQRRRQEEDSQEQEFEDDSQVTNNDTVPEESGQSQSQAVGQLDTIFELDDGLNDVLLSDDGEPSPTPELRAEGPERSPRSSPEDDELPDPNDIEKWKTHKTARRAHKRRASPKASSKRKVSRLGNEAAEATKDTSILPDIDDIFDIPVSPPRTSPDVLAVTPMAVVNRLRGISVAAMTPKPSSNISSRIHSPAPAHQHSELIDLTMLENGDSDVPSEDDVAMGASPAASESEPDEVRLGARKIRGVLPASWLRLDQQTSARKAKAAIRHRSPVISPDRSAKKGVAQRRYTSTQQGLDSALFLSDDSDDSDSTVRLQAPNISFPDISAPAVDDDTASIIEEDHIDHMFSRSRMKNPGSTAPQKKRKRGQQSTFSGQAGQRKRQQRITGILNRTKSVSRTQNSRTQVSESSMSFHQAKSRNIGKKKIISRPAPLGILDVVEPNAPAFIRIAARTASKRRDKGRSSPSKKVIMLGTRQDTIDAVGVLNRWKEGSIQPRETTSSSRSHPRRDIVYGATQGQVSQASTPRRKPSNLAKPLTRFTRPHRMIKQTSMDSFVNVEAQDQPKLNLHADDSVIETARLRDPFVRPAQLETSGDFVNRNTFTARKRALDALYRKSRKSVPTSQHLHLEQSIRRKIPEEHEQSGTGLPKPGESNTACELLKNKPLENKRRVRHRKQIRPQSVDVSAPQYTHANDPLPRELSPPTAASDSPKHEAAGKLLGLAPYGTHYTQHFEVFPLDRGVFFHESTIIGSGRLKKALDGKSLDNFSSHRGWCTFTLDEQSLRWGPWNAQTSSELGIIFDWVIDRLDHASSDASQFGPTTPVQATDFILLYLQNHLSLSGSDSIDIFAGRSIDVLKGFERRLQETPGITKHATQSCVETLTRILVIITQVLRICQKFEKVAETFQLEELLKRVAVFTAGVLFQTRLKEVQNLYNSLQQLSFRERGLRHDEYSIICWVTLIRILEEVRLPRAGFWGVISPVILGSTVDGTVEATVFEQAWWSMFTLLPLGEFDNTGVAIPGTRYTAPLEGWTIPQRLVRRIIDLYNNNSRQSPSFNDYLRALMSRCHYLVEQWGWDKCNGILGTIFDFFAGQEFHNLRNEEVYQSPQFLEELSESPSLATSLEDRCFHIYLKLVAISIKRLRKSGLVKEIKNLVARLLPNHSRQYDKMVATHEAEIAALRNHHDLLCTLFWAAPSELRPSVQSIEGLVAIRSSHKEACLISLRAWSRLSRFVVSTCEDISSYKPLADWQRNI
ncbi:hypothetical protein NPX13_g9683 [Xylaria arbuscula]|uniref:Uncharacterized protein n=1 Tax=Xylaria arbuscula TaxID=114810 RepID=A0A9W8N680_9PEZI|nr:hypothetical protein NPX13_g9683 [Xylaria arbuscula]